MNSKLLLGYWPTRGLAERIRLLMQYLQIPYEQIKHDGNNRKIWYQQIKPKLISKNPAVNLPYLQDGDRLISETNAIIVYLIHKSERTQLLGRSLQEKIRMATALGVTEDIYKIYIDLTYGALNQECFEDKLAQYCPKFQGYLEKLNKYLGNHTFYAGQNITWADFTISEIMWCMRLMAPSLMSNYDHICRHIDRIWGLPPIKQYHKSDRYVERPCNSPGYSHWY